MFELISPLY